MTPVAVGHDAAGRLESYFGGVCERLVAPLFGKGDLWES